jgi:hypothetical protein
MRIRQMGDCVCLGHPFLLCYLLCVQKVLAIQEERQRGGLGKINARDQGNAEDQY